MGKGLAVTLAVIIAVAVISSLSTYWLTSAGRATVTVTRVEPTTITKLRTTTVTRTSTTATTVTSVRTEVRTVTKAFTVTVTGAVPPPPTLDRDVTLLSMELNRMLASALLEEFARLATAPSVGIHSSALSPARRLLTDLVGRFAPQVIAWPGMGKGEYVINYTAVRETPNFVVGGAPSTSCVTNAGVSKVLANTSNVVEYVNASALKVTSINEFIAGGLTKVVFTYTDYVVRKGEGTYLVLESTSIKAGAGAPTNISAEALYEGVIPVKLVLIMQGIKAINMTLNEDGSLTITFGNTSTRVPRVKEAIEDILGSLNKVVTFKGVANGFPTYGFSLAGNATTAFGNVTFSLRLKLKGEATYLGDGVLLIKNVTVTLLKISITLRNGTQARNYCVYLSTPLKGYVVKPEIAGSK